METSQEKLKRLVDEYVQAEIAYAHSSTPYSAAWASKCRQELHEFINSIGGYMRTVM